MTWPRLALTAALGVALVGCGSDEPEASPGQPAAGQATTPQATAETPTQQAQQRAPVRTPPTTQRQQPTTARQSVRAARVDEPWTPTHTGTVTPGMTREEVVGVWGDPVAERSSSSSTFLFYRNGCEVTCGMLDVVFLEGGQVVDAVVRGRGHVYGGTSSSPPDRAARPTLPGMVGTSGAS